MEILPITVSCLISSVRSRSSSVEDLRHAMLFTSHSSFEFYLFNLKPEVLVIVTQ